MHLTEFDFLTRMIRVDIRIDKVTTLPLQLSLLVAHSEIEGFSFVRRLVNEWFEGSNQFNSDGEFLLAAQVQNQCVGVCGVNIDPYTENKGIARLRHLYVLQAYRSSGVGTLLVRECIKRLDPGFTELRLRVPNVATGRFYEKLGFIGIDNHRASHTMCLTQ